MKLSYSIFFVLIGFLSQIECILNGEIVRSEDLKKYKYLVSIYIENHEEGRAVTCGGGILNDRMILTAAHCFAKWRNNYISDHGKIIVTAHTLTSRTDAASRGSIVRKVERIYVPTEYFDGGFADIAILRLKKSLNFVKNFDKLKALALPEKLLVEMLPKILPGTTPATTSGTLPYLHEEAIVAGYGAHTSEWDPMKGDYVYTWDDALRTMNVIVVPKPATDTDPNTDRRFVKAQPTGTQSSLGLCDGDGGSPLVIKSKPHPWSSTVYTVIGVVRGNTDSCDDRIRFGSYVRVTTYLSEFIDKVLDNPDISDPAIKVRHAALSC